MGDPNLLAPKDLAALSFCVLGRVLEQFLGLDAPGACLQGGDPQAGKATVYPKGVDF